jgi:hypothetical protein
LIAMANKGHIYAQFPLRLRRTDPPKIKTSGCGSNREAKWRTGGCHLEYSRDFRSDNNIIASILKRKLRFPMARAPRIGSALFPNNVVPIFQGISTPTVYKEMPSSPVPVTIIVSPFSPSLLPGLTRHGCVCSRPLVYTFLFIILGLAYSVVGIQPYR